MPEEFVTRSLKLDGTGEAVVMVVVVEMVVVEMTPGVNGT